MWHVCWGIKGVHHHCLVSIANCAELRTLICRQALFVRAQTEISTLKMEQFPPPQS